MEKKLLRHVFKYLQNILGKRVLRRNRRNCCIKTNRNKTNKRTLSRCILAIGRSRQSCTFFSLALDESTDICGVAQLGIFIRGIDDHFNVFEELLSLESMHGKTRGSDIFNKVKSCLENLKLYFSKLVSVCTDGAPSMVGKVAGAATWLENFLNHSILKYHCIIHQEAVCGKTLNMQHVMLPVLKCANKIKARALNKRQFKEYCQLLDFEYVHCEVRWLSKGQCLSRF